MACRKIRQKSHFFFSTLDFFFLIVVTLSINCSAWNPENCPNFCECFSLYGLRWADCTGHRLYSIQTGIDEAVQALDLSNNSVSSLANHELGEAGLAKLKLLNLSSNAISEIGLTAFVGLTDLRVLDLSKNHLYYLLSDTFVENKKLEVLELAGNNLNQHVPKLRISSLGSLDLGNCGISHLPSRTFDGLPKLRALDLTNNMMIQLKPDILKSLPNLEILMIERNPWSCNKEMYELQNRLRDRRIIFKRVCNYDESRSSNNIPKKFEKMIHLDVTSTSQPEGSSGRLLAKIKNWRNGLKIDKSSKRCDSHVTSTEITGDVSLASSLKKMSPYWFLAVGFLLGSAITTVLMYLWLTRSFSMALTNPRIRTTMGNDNAEIANQRANLLQHLWQNNDDTSHRSTSDCPGTPPPPYRDVMLDSNLYPRPYLRAPIIAFVHNDRLEEG